ncbi:MAG: bile acid:sodium symporter family protein [Bacteroidota bacterium]
MKPWIIMRKGIQLNQLFEKRMFFIVGSGIALGALFNGFFILIKSWVPYLFAYITIAVSLNCSFSDFKKVFKAPGLLLTIMGLLHLFLPFMALILARIFLPGQPLLQAGIVLITAAPIGVASTMWTSISGGNVPLALTTVITDTILSPMVVPLIMLVTIGQKVQFNIPSLMWGLAWMIVVPTIIGMTLHDLTKGEISRNLKFVTGPSSKLFLGIIVAVNLAAAWNSLSLLKSSISNIAILVFIMGCSGYLIGFAYARLFKFSPDIINTFVFSVGMRNNTAGLVLALNYFPEITAVPVVLVILFQQPLAAVSHHLLTRLR